MVLVSVLPNESADALSSTPGDESLLANVEPRITVNARVETPVVSGPVFLTIAQLTEACREALQRNEEGRSSPALSLADSDSLSLSPLSKRRRDGAWNPTENLGEEIGNDWLSDGEDQRDLFPTDEGREKNWFSTENFFSKDERKQKNWFSTENFFSKGEGKEENLFSTENLFSQDERKEGNLLSTEEKMGEDLFNKDKKIKEDLVFIAEKKREDLPLEEKVGENLPNEDLFLGRDAKEEFVTDKEEVGCAPSLVAKVTESGGAESERDSQGDAWLVLESTEEEEGGTQGNQEGSRWLVLESTGPDDPPPCQEPPEDPLLAYLGPTLPVLQGEELTRCLPASWANSGAVLHELDPRDPTYVVLHDMFSANAASRKLEVCSIHRVENPFLHLCYELKKAELEQRNEKCEELRLFHGTKHDVYMNICENNFDWRKYSRVKHRFGQGVSFTPLASYASHYTDRFDDERENKMFLARVLVTKTCPGQSRYAVPPKGFDTTVNHELKVYVKFDDFTYVPEFLFSYRNALPDLYAEKLRMREEERRAQRGEITVWLPPSPSLLPTPQLVRESPRFQDPFLMPQACIEQLRNPWQSGSAPWQALPLPAMVPWPAWPERQVSMQGGATWSGGLEREVSLQRNAVWQAQRELELLKAGGPLPGGRGPHPHGGPLPGGRAPHPQNPPTWQTWQNKPWQNKVNNKQKYWGKRKNWAGKRNNAR